MAPRCGWRRMHRQAPRPTLPRARSRLAPRHRRRRRVPRGRARCRPRRRRTRRSSPPVSAAARAQSNFRRSNGIRLQLPPPSRGLCRGSLPPPQAGEGWGGGGEPAGTLPLLVREHGVSPSRLFILRPVATSLLMAAIMLVGMVAYRFLPLSALPEVDYPTIQVVTLYPGASPDVMTSSVTSPLEVRLGQMPGVNQLPPASPPGCSALT